MLWAILIAVALLVGAFIYLSAVFYWQEQQIKGATYFGRPLEGRRRVKRVLRFHSRVLTPLVWAMSRTSKFVFAKVSFRHLGIAGPVGTCSAASFDRGAAYSPTAEDVLVVTQMRSGTTWLQQLAYEVLCRGAGDLVESGRALYSVSAWLEAETGVPLNEAPLIGDERPSRVIKTHFPARLCPVGESARYIYLIRHPVACFASCADYVRTNAGPFTPSSEVLEEWFCSDAMWWGPWTEHAAGWWARSQQSNNVLFLRFEDLLANLPGIAQRVAGFLGLTPLSGEEVERVVSKSSFEYMKRNDEMFEMHPPRLFAVDRTLFVRGDSERDRSVAESVQHRISAWCTASIRGGTFPLREFYPDLAGTAGGS